MIIAWFLVNLLLYYALAYSNVGGQTQEIIGTLAGFVTVLTGLVLLYNIYLYLSASMTFTQSGVEVVRYSSLFSAKRSVIEWENVELVTATSNGVIRLLGDIGTIRIETASAEPNLALSWVGNLEQVRTIAAGLADAAD